MGLLDAIMSAKGDASSNWAQPGTFLIKLNRLRLKDPSEPGADPFMKPGFSFDGEVVFSTNPQHNKQEMVAFNDPFKYPPSALARIRRLLAAAKTAKTGAPVNESTMGLTVNDGETEAAFAERIKAEVKRLLGAEQPLGGALIKVVVTGGKNKETGGAYSLFEGHAPSESDLKIAGLI